MNYFKAHITNLHPFSSPPCEGGDGVVVDLVAVFILRSSFRNASLITVLNT